MLEDKNFIRNSGRLWHVSWDLLVSVAGHQTANQASLHFPHGLFPALSENLPIFLLLHLSRQCPYVA